MNAINDVQTAEDLADAMLDEAMQVWTDAWNDFFVGLIGREELHQALDRHIAAVRASNAKAGPPGG